jgi:hypothetical protein
MSRRWVHADEWDEDEWDEEDEESTVPCPYCHRDIHEDSLRCPYCEQYISEEDEQPAARKPWWLYGGVLICLYLVYRWIAG